MTGVELTADKPRRISARSDTLPPAAAAVSQSLEDERDKADLKTHTETVANGRHQYPLRVAGTVDGATTRDPVGYSNYSQAWENNLFLCMETDRMCAIGCTLKTTAMLSILYYKKGKLMDIAMLFGMD